MLFPNVIDSSLFVLILFWTYLVSLELILLGAAFASLFKMYPPYQEARMTDKEFYQLSCYNITLFMVFAYLSRRYIKKYPLLDTKYPLLLSYRRMFLYKLYSF